MISYGDMMPSEDGILHYRGGAKTPGSGIIFSDHVRASKEQHNERRGRHDTFRGRYYTFGADITLLRLRDNSVFGVITLRRPRTPSKLTKGARAPCAHATLAAPPRI